VFCPPGNCFTQLDQSAATPGDNRFAGLFGRFHVQVNAPGQIKAAFYWGIDLGGYFYEHDYTD
jgi:hypothetical protein